LHVTALSIPRPGRLSSRRRAPSWTAALRNAIDYDIDDRLEDVAAHGLAGEQQPQVNRAEHGLDDLAGLGTGRDLPALDRLLDDDAVQGKTLVPEATVRRGKPAVVWQLRHHGASHRRDFRAARFAAAVYASSKRSFRSEPVLGTGMCSPARSSIASSWLAGVEITMLTTTGAKTGMRRTPPVLGLPDGEDTILIAFQLRPPAQPVLVLQPAREPQRDDCPERHQP
jgi:hypothetical protein